MSIPKRIAFDARYISDRYHGIGRYAFRLLEALVAAAPEQTFIVFRGRATDSRFPWDQLVKHSNVEVYPGPWPLYVPHEQLLWPGILRRFQADLFFTPYFVAALSSRLPQVVTVHDLIFDRYPAYMPTAWARPYYRFLLAHSLRKARRVVAVSQATASDLGAFYALPPERVAVIPAGVEPGFQPVSDPDRLEGLRRRYQLPADFILSVGARRPHKNLGRLVQAFADLQPANGVQLVFAGSPDPRFPDDAHQTAQQLNLDGRVRFLGWVPESDLPGLYSLATLVAFPSLVEGFGLPALEAMAHGTPVLASSSSSLPEVIGEAGLLVDPTDTRSITAGLGNLLQDEALRRRFAAAGRERAATFTWERAARQALEVFAAATP